MEGLEDNNMSLTDVEEVREKCNTKESNKRVREPTDCDEDETTVSETKKKKNLPDKDDLSNSKEFEIYVYCKDKVPKIFALAKLLKTHNIQNISEVKYINPYKMKIQFENEHDLEKLKSNDTFTTMGWKFQEDIEVNISYGVIKDVDLDLSQNDIMNTVSCPGEIEIISVRRLYRRFPNKEGWWPSEAVRLGFKGGSLPAYVSTDGIKLLVRPYVYAVTQCSQCWKLGHSSRSCNSNEIICPKCGGGHSECETTSFQCVNCSGAHMAISKMCPVYIKEKQIRVIMAELNCTYEKAKTLYVPAEKDFAPKKLTNQPAELPIVTPHTLKNITALLSELVTCAADKHDHSSAPSQQTPVEQSKSGKEKEANRGHDDKRDFPSDPDSWTHQSSSKSESKNNSYPPNENNTSESLFGELLCKIKEIIFLRDLDIADKLKNIVKLSIEWLILIAVDNISDWPLFKLIVEYFNG